MNPLKFIKFRYPATVVAVIVTSEEDEKAKLFCEQRNDLNLRQKALIATDYYIKEYKNI